MISINSLLIWVSIICLALFGWLQLVLFENINERTSSAPREISEIKFEISEIQKSLEYLKWAAEFRGKVTEKAHPGLSDLVLREQYPGIEKVLEK